MSTLITYHVLEDREGKLQAAARLACNFWNHYLEPETSVVIHIDLFWSPLSYIARSYEPERKGGVTHGRIRFNSVYVKRYSEMQLAITLVHELAHTLGFGWDRWLALFDPSTGRFTPAAVQSLPALEDMRVETDGGAATEYMHWDETVHGSELMTGFENLTEHVLPVTVDVMALLGHQVVRRLEARTRIQTLLAQWQDQPFTRQAEARQLAEVEVRPSRILERIYEFAAGRKAPVRPQVRPGAGRSPKSRKDR